MATQREKQLAALLLKERLERVTGKKVVLKEGGATLPSNHTIQVVSKALLDFMNMAYENSTPEEGHRGMTALVNELNKQLDYDGVGLKIVEVPV